MNENKYEQQIMKTNNISPNIVSQQALKFRINTKTSKRKQTTASDNAHSNLNFYARQNLHVCKSFAFEICRVG